MTSVPGGGATPLSARRRGGRRPAWLHAILIGTLVALALGVSGCADRLFYRPSGPPDSLEGIHPRLEQTWFRAPNGPPLHGIWLRAEGEQRGTIVYCHGNTGNVASQARNVTWLPTHGFDVLVFDYRGYGSSDGTPTREGTVEDALAAIDLALAHDPERTIVFGHSLGGAIGIVAVAERPAVRGVIAESTFASYRDVARDRAGWLGWLVPLLVSDDLEPRDFVAAIPPRPLLVIHGRRDGIVPIRHGEALFAAAQPPKRFHLAHDSGHATPWFREGIAFEAKIVEFCAAALSGKDAEPSRQSDRDE